MLSKYQRMNLEAGFTGATKRARLHKNCLAHDHGPTLNLQSFERGNLGGPTEKGKHLSGTFGKR